MPDLFYTQGETLADKIDMLKKDLLIYAKKLGCNKRKISILQGTESCVGNNVLVISPPFIGASPFEEPSDKALKYILSKYEIKNYFLTYANSLPLARHTKIQIKEFSTWINKIIDIVLPKLIVVLGEESQLVFFRRKFILRDFHGQIIGYHSDIPIILVHPMDYYIEKSAFEDSQYKLFIESKDWSTVKTEYDRRIKNANNV